MAELVEFWRVENDLREGPYNCPGENPLTGMTNIDVHPYPSEDGLDFKYSVLDKHLFGFQSERQLREWFTTELLTRLAEADSWWYVVCRNVDSRLIHHGGRQSIVLQTEVHSRLIEKRIRVDDFLAMGFIPDIPVDAQPLDEIPDPPVPGADDD